MHHAWDLAVHGRRLAASIPRGDRDLAAQLRRSATAPALLIGEGANRLNAGEKRQRFNEARGEACEAAVAVELAASPGLVPAVEAEPLLAAADKVTAMLTGLLRKHSGTPRTDRLISDGFRGSRGGTATVLARCGPTMQDVDRRCRVSWVGGDHRLVHEPTRSREGRKAQMRRAL